jgi:AcrR family transcriptional regulator
METLKEIKSKIEINKAEKKTRLLNNAYELFGTKGFAETSISDIVKKAGVAKGTFYLYFKNKDDIRNHLVTDQSQRLFTNAINAMNNEKLDTFDERLIFIIDHVIEQLKEDDCILTFINRDLCLGFYSKEIEKIFNDNAMGLYQMFINGIKKENIDVKNPDMTFFMIVELIGTTCYRCMVQKIPCDIDTYKPYLYAGVKALIHQ